MMVLEDAQEDTQDQKGGRPAVLPEKKKERLIRAHIQGAYVRSGASILIGVLTFVAYLKDTISFGSLVGSSVTLLFIILMNVPMIALIRRIDSRRWFEICSFTVNGLEIMGYTAFIYFVGGFRSTYLTPIYAALIFYVGVMAPLRYPLIVAGLCSIAFSTMVYLEHFGYLPHQNIFLVYNYSWDMVSYVLFVLTAVLFVIAFMASYTSWMLAGARKSLKEKNAALVAANERLSHEIEERIRVENALRKSERKLQDIFDNVQDALFTHDLEGRFVEMNRWLRDFLGPGTTMEARIHDMVPAEHNKGVEEYLADVVARGSREGLMTAVRHDGERRVFEYRTSLITDEDGRPIGVRGSARDVTDRIRAERDRLRLKEQLQHAQKMEAIGLLAGGVAHDLNNILSGLVSYPDLLLMEIPEDSPLRKPITTIKQSGEKAASIVQDLLTMARRGVRVTEVVDLNRVVLDYVNSLECARLKETHPHVRLEVRLDPGIKPIQGSPIHLFKTVMNLVTNAFESIPKEGMVEVQTCGCMVEEDKDPGKETKGRPRFGDYAALVVKDTGMGMTEQDRQRIFEPFYTRKVMGRSGTGLGMAVVWGTVKDHDGFVEIESEPGRGSKFTLFFPACTESVLPPGEEGTPPTVEPDGEGRSILVVDDVEEQRCIAREMLERLGYRVETVSSGEEALEYIKDHTMDLVLLDMIMSPGMDGLETYRKIIEMKPFQKAIIVSGYTEGERLKEALELGVAGYVRKPYLIQNLALAVKDALERRAA